jgi:hypothetical protein
MSILSFDKPLVFTLKIKMIAQANKFVPIRIEAQPTPVKIWVRKFIVKTMLQIKKVKA